MIINEKEEEEMREWVSRGSKEDLCISREISRKSR